MNQLPGTGSSDILDVLLPHEDLTSVGERSGRTSSALTPTPRPRPKHITTDVTPGLSAPAMQRAPVFELSADTTPGQISVNRTRLVRAKLSLNSIRDLFRLASHCDGWRGPGSRCLDLGSLSTFLEFWASFATLRGRKEPVFALGPNGNLVAEWYKNKYRHLDVEFCSDSRLYFGLFNGDLVIEGIATSAELTSVLRTLTANPLQWSDG